ncbi:MAG: DUF4421 domain-containing protein [Chitinophagaceae bacterium]|nr:DUF4421 domain-containing protein [Chitinophagaceae bacterium]
MHKCPRTFASLFSLAQLIFWTGFFFPANGYSQERDTTYIEPYTKLITGRVFLSEKYTIFGLEGPKQIQYRPNTRLSLGLGATYRALTLSIGYGFAFLNKDGGRGKTKYLDLQTHLYGAKWRYDLFGQFYKGYYIYPKGFAAAVPGTYYIRPDLQVNEIGVSAFHIYNNKRFSYRAAFLQSEWQKKSAGSFLLGGSFVYGSTKADSAFIPARESANYQQKDIRRLRYFELGPGAGYVYTFVWKQHWYITASATVSLDLGFVKETAVSDVKHSINLSPNFMFRSGIGYNSSTWNYNFAWVSNRTSVDGQFNNGGYNINTGNYRFTIAKRFTPGKKLRKMLSVVDNILDKALKK